MLMAHITGAAPWEAEPVLEIQPIDLKPPFPEVAMFGPTLCDIVFYTLPMTSPPGSEWMSLEVCYLGAWGRTEIANASVHDRGAGQFALTDVCVNVHNQRNGLGRMMVAAVEAVARQRNGLRMSVEALHEASGFYQKLGYASLGSSARISGCETMIKDLTQSEVR